MRDNSRFGHIQAYAGGGAVQEALPIQFAPVGAPASANPYSDLTEVLSEGPTQTGPEINTDLIDKAPGLMGEKRALLNRIRTLKMSIDAKALEDKLWLRTNDGIRAVTSLQNMLSTAPSDLKRSEEITNEGTDRVKANNSQDEYVTDLHSGKIAVNDASNNGALALVSQYDLYKDNKEGTHRYFPIDHNEARLSIEKGNDTPYESNTGLYMKNMLGQIKGTEERQKEIDNQLKQAGSTATNYTTSAYLLSKDSGELGKSLREYGFDSNRLLDMKTTEDDKSNIKQMNAAINIMLDSPQGLSTETKNGLRNAAMKIVNNSNPGGKTESESAYNTHVDNTMKGLLVQLIAARADTTTTRRSDASITQEQIERPTLTAPINFQLDNMQGLKAIPLNNSLIVNNGKLETPMTNGLAGLIDYSGVRIGNGSNPLTPDQNKSIVNGLHTSTGHVTYLPYSKDSKGDLTLATQAYKGDKPEEIKASEKGFLDTQDKYLELIEAARKSGRTNDVEKLGNEMKVDLTQYFKPGITMRTAIVYNGYYAATTHTFKQDDANRIRSNGGINHTDNAAEWIASGLSKKDNDQLWETQVIVPLVETAKFDAMIQNSTPLKNIPQSKQTGGKIKILNIGGKLVSFNDLKNL